MKEGGASATTHETVSTGRIADVDPVAAVVGVEIFTPIFVESATPASTHGARCF